VFEHDDAWLPPWTYHSGIPLIACFGRRSSAFDGSFPDQKNCVPYIEGKKGSRHGEVE
jgi:hypothetical protein